MPISLLDPFTGTGTFITRLLQSGLIRKDQLEYKYKNEIHANEIVLLAYYIAAINIEATYHALSGGDYAAFNGICLTDTFEMYESDDLVARLMEDNSERRNRQKALDIRVIVGNPPYNVADTGVTYKDLNARIGDTYAARTSSTNKNSLYDSYIKAIRWASDRVGDSGVIGFVVSANWLDGTALNGVRQCLIEEFSSIYILNLRGNQYTSGELSKKEGGKIFGSGSRTPICIALFVKNSLHQGKGEVYYFDIGDYLTREQKLHKIQELGSVAGMADGFNALQMDEYGDWLNKRDRSFECHIQVNGGNKSLFQITSRGVETGRDAWVYNASIKQLNSNIQRMGLYYNSLFGEFDDDGKKKRDELIVDNDKKIKWTSSLKSCFKRSKKWQHKSDAIRHVLYRPFNKEVCYFDDMLIHRRGKQDQIFANFALNNMTIVVTGKSAKEFSVTISDMLTDVNLLAAGAQCLPLKLYEKVDTEDEGLFASDSVENGYRVKDGITDYGLKHFQSAYGNAAITKEDVFYYTYGLLHSNDYRTRFADNLSKELPRIPAVKQEADFWAFSEAGRKLGDLHVNYESVDKYPVTFSEGALELATIDDPVSFYRVEKMKFAGKRPNLDKTTVHYNNNIRDMGKSW